MSSYYPRTKDLTRTRKSVTDSPPSSPSYTDKNYRLHCVLRWSCVDFRYDSTGESATDKPMGRTSSYTRRETRLAALNKQEQDSAAKDYKKMYTEALQENERLKSRLQDSKQELVKIRSQLEKVAQVPIFQCFKEFEKTCQEMETKFKWKMEMEKKWSHHILPNNEKQALDKRVTDMEEEIKVLTELKSDNQRLKDENGALIRVISKLSK
uniref:cGMP-dependent protein kinase interacting domain-containing protein n=1 Tax=Xiphophorus couchianus TaxID=32473 RepID=A0A3B5MBX8_9TELE